MDRVLENLNEPPRNASVTPFQETFDKGLMGINRQNALGRDHRCNPVYYIPYSGIRCVGHLVLDEYIHLMANAYDHVGVMLPRQRSILGLDRHDLDLMCAMQDAHDASCRIEDSNEAMRNFHLRMILVTQRFHINAKGVQHD